MANVWYCTREEVKAALDVRENARANAKIDRIIESSSRQVEAILHRRFYPEIATRSFAWPDPQGGTSYDLWLDDSELVSLTTLSANGGVIPASGYYLNPVLGPPFSRVSINRASTYAFGGGLGQRDIAITGTFGYQNEETTGPVLAVSCAAGDATITTAPGFVGVGALIRVDSERMIVTSKAQVSTGQTLGANLTAAVNVTSVPVADGTQIATGETILIDAEYMRVVDVAGNNLIVQRGWDGSVLAPHNSGTTIYAPRRLTVARGQLGTTAAAHANAASIARFVFPGPVRIFTMALTIDTIEQESAAYARTTGSGNSIRDTGGRGLEIARKNAMTACGRFNRTAAI